MSASPPPQALLAAIVESLAALESGASDAAARSGAQHAAALASTLESGGRGDLSLLLDEIGSAWRGALSAPAARRGMLVAALREASADVDTALMRSPDTDALRHLARVNALRALRGAAGVQHATLLAGDMRARSGDVPSRPASLRRLRAWYQQSLLGWLRGGQPGESLELMRSVLGRVADTCAGTPHAPLWHCAVRFAEALPETRAAGEHEALRLLRLLDDELRASASEATLAPQDAGDATLVEALLDYTLAHAPGHLPLRRTQRDAAYRRAEELLEEAACVLRAATPGRAAHAVPAAARTAADVLGLLAASTLRRRVLACCQALRAPAADVPALAEDLEALAREAAAAGGRPVMAAALTSDLEQLRETLARVAGVCALEPAGVAPAQVAAAAELARATGEQIDEDTLHNLAALAGDLDLGRTRLDEQVGSVRAGLDGMECTLLGLRERLLRIENAAAPPVAMGPGEEPGLSGEVEELARGLRELAEQHRALGAATRSAQALLAAHTRTHARVREALPDHGCLGELRLSLEHVVSSFASEFGCETVLAVEGGDQRLPCPAALALEALRPLIDNALRHGIEEPAVRAARDKPVAGRLRVSLTRSGAWAVIAVQDDGRGLDHGLFAARAAALGLLLSPALHEGGETRMTVSAHLPVATEFTAKGLAAAAIAARRAGGALHLHTRPGSGVCALLRLPDRERMRSLVAVEAGGHSFAVPLADVVGVARIDPGAARDGDGALSVQTVDSLFWAEETSWAQPGRALPALLFGCGGKRLALLTERIVERLDTTVLAVGLQLADCAWLAGATVTTDGRMLPVLDLRAAAAAHLATRSAALPPLAVPR